MSRVQSRPPQISSDTPGDEATIRPGELHRLFNAGDGEAHVLEGVRPDECRYAA